MVQVSPWTRIVFQCLVLLPDWLHAEYHKVTFVVLCDSFVKLSVITKSLTFKMLKS